MSYLHTRTEAGQLLSENLRNILADPTSAVILGVAKGGVEVASAISKALRTPLDALVIRKLKVPNHPDLAFGAIAPKGIRFLNEIIIRAWHVSEFEIARITKKERTILEQHEKVYRYGRQEIRLDERVAVLVDDGLATGATIRSAIRWAQRERAAKIIVAAPVANQEICKEIEDEGSCELLILKKVKEPFYSVKIWYDEFPAIRDDDVICLLKDREREIAADTVYHNLSS